MSLADTGEKGGQMPGRLGRIFARTVVLALSCVPPARAVDTRAPTNTAVIPVVVKAAALPGLLGTSPLQLTALTCLKDGSLSPVPFQVDEYSEDGHLLSNLPGESSEDESAGRVNARDEVVFALRDVGGECPESRLAELRGNVVHARVEAEYLHAPGALYFVVAERSARLSRRYVRYSSAEDRVLAGAYDIGFMKDNALIGDYFVSHELRGRQGVNIFDRMKFRFAARTLGDLITVRGDEDDLVAKLRSVRVGPVRILREVSVAFTPVPGVTINTDVTLTFYERMWQIRARVRMPQAAALFTSSMDAVISIDYRDKRGIRLSTKEFPEGVLVDGKMLASERSLSMGDEFWYQETGEGINLVAILEINDEFPVEPRVHFIDGASPAKPPESEPGGYPELGYELLGWENLKAKTYEFGITIAMLRAFPEGGGRGFYRVYGSRVRVRQVGAEGGGSDS